MQDDQKIVGMTVADGDEAVVAESSRALSRPVQTPSRASGGCGVKQGSQ
mgnify:CR=1 FL=1